MKLIRELQRIVSRASVYWHEGLEIYFLRRREEYNAYLAWVWD